MKKIIFIGIALLSSIEWVHAQEQDSISGWNFSTDVNLYIMQNDFFALPVFRADKDRLHLEARYNYEDRETFSGWIGYKFSGGNDNFSYAFTPMLGGVVGLSKGIAPGLEMTLAYKNFELYSEMENLFDLSNKENNFYYNWADLTYSPLDWLWVGISGQRTRLYQTELDIQRGLLVGASVRRFEFTTYVYNVGFDDPFLILTLSASF
jgi:hypothetical protein